jgi:hypothetical protein
MPKKISLEDKFEYFDYECGGCKSTFILNYKCQECPGCNEKKDFVMVAYEARPVPNLEVIALDLRYVERRLDALERQIVKGQMKKAGQDYEL